MPDRSDHLRPRAYSYVRMSTATQLKGDSLRRQLELSRRYAAAHGLDLVHDTLEDIGVSAFRGANVESGALGRFLEAARAGQIPAGSSLLIESLDRLSRQEIMTSLTMFMELLSRGIHIVTLADEHCYRAGETDAAELMMSIVVMSRAHEESRTKSQRLSATWANKRRQAATRKLTAKCPAWLALSADGSAFELIQDRARVVRRIFEDSAAGIGSYAIARRLNAAAEPPFGSSRGWQTSYVTKVLHSRAALGEFQPHRMVNGRRIPDGPAIERYFPPAVDESLFYRAHASRASRRTYGGGRKGKFISNLFSGLASCAYCGARMHFVDKGFGPKGGTYLVCDSGRRGLGCEKAGWRYDHFEATFLAFVEELNLEPMVHDDGKRRDLHKQLAALQGRESELNMRRERTYELIVEAQVSTRYIREQLDRCEQDLAVTRGAIAKVRKELEESQVGASRFYEGRTQIKELITRFRGEDDEEIYQLRAAIASRLRGIVCELLIAPSGHAPLTRSTLQTLEPEPNAEQSDLGCEVLEALRMELSTGRADQRYFVVSFKDGTMRGVRPGREDPFDVIVQLYRTEEGVWRLGPSGKDTLVVPAGDPADSCPTASSRP